MQFRHSFDNIDTNTLDGPSGTCHAVSLLSCRLRFLKLTKPLFKSLMANAAKAASPSSIYISHLHLATHFSLLLSHSKSLSCPPHLAPPAPPPPPPSSIHPWPPRASTRRQGARRARGVAQDREIGGASAAAEAGDHLHGVAQDHPRRAHEFMSLVQRLTGQGRRPRATAARRRRRRRRGGAQGRRRCASRRGPEPSPPAARPCPCR